jgi:elongation factor P--beta-lysine ligase
VKRGDHEQDEGEQDRKHGEERIAQTLLQTTEALLDGVVHASKSLPELTGMRIGLRRRLLAIALIVD